MGVPTTERVATLLEDMTGPVLTERDGAYDEVRRVHNGLVDKRPAVIARCVTSADVAAAVRAGREAGLEISVRGGGHNVTGKAVTDGGLMIDLSLMKRVDIDSSDRTITAEGGVLWGELNDAAHELGLATTGGVVSTTGISGLTLGGGVGWLEGKFGIAIDNLLSAEVVLASGDVVTANDMTDPDLFWAIRGGGGNFGVVTSFTYRAYPLTTVLGGIAAFPLERTREVLARYREVTESASDDLEAYLGFTHSPDGSGAKLVAIVVCHAGDPEAAEAEVQPIRALGPMLDVIDRIPYPVQNTFFNDAYPKGALNYWKSAFFTELPDEAGEKMVDSFERTPHPMCTFAIEHFHGAVTRVPPTATAYPHRKPGYDLILTAVWDEPSYGDACIAWARETLDSLRPHMSDQVYVNYLDADDEGRIRSAYGPNYDRLVELKRRYDPENIFRLNQNIAP